MRSLKKILALVMAIAMIMSVTAFAGFTDAADIDADYAEAVAVLNGMGVFKGYTDGSFAPQGDITRAEVAAIIYRIATADVDDDYVDLWKGTAGFADVADAAWYAGYVGFCASNGYVQGYPDGTFKPQGKVTGLEALAMILRVVGYDAEKEFSGMKWADNIAKVAVQNGILGDIKPGALAKAAPREMVAQLLFGALNTKTVSYTLLTGYTANDKTLGEQNFKLACKVDTADAFGRPGYKYTYTTGNEKTSFSKEPLASYVVATKNCDIYEDTGLKKGTELDVYTNSAEAKGKYTVADNTTKFGAQGQLVEFYKDRVVVVDTYLAEVTKVVAEKTDSRGHVTKAYVNAAVWNKGDDTTTTIEKYETADFAKGDMVLVTVADGKIKSMEIAESEVAKLTKVEGAAKKVTDIQKIVALAKEDVTVNVTADLEPTLELGKPYTFYYDANGNVIGAEVLATNYAVLDALYTTVQAGEDANTGSIVFWDASMAEDIAIEKINGEDSFATTLKGNDDYYIPVYTWTEEDGEYELKTADFEYAAYGEFRNGKVYMMHSGNAAPLQISKSTQILLRTEAAPNGEYAAYTGYSNLPSFEAENIFYTLDEDGYVDMMFAEAYEFTSRVVFIYDINAITSETTDDETVYVAEVEALELIDGELKEVTIDVLYSGESAFAPVRTIGLYEITEGADDYWYAVRQYTTYGVDQITADGKRVLIDGDFYALDDAQVIQYVGSWTAGSYEDDYSAKDLNTESIVFVQFDEDGEAVVVYDIWVKLAATIAPENTGAEFVTLPAMYFGKKVGAVEIKVPAYYDLVGASGAAWTIDTAADKHDVASIVKVTTADKLWDDVVFTLAEDAKHDSTWLVAKEPAINVNMTVSVAGSEVTVEGTEPTVKVNDLLAWLSTECEFATMKLYDNTGANEVTSGDVDFDNMCIVVTAENGIAKTYTLVGPATDAE